jgi:lipopolysaccharide/colanic/teichoic acid biosynthesis glycosyltransferase
MKNTIYTTIRSFVGQQHESNKGNFGTVYHSKEYNNEIFGEKVFQNILYIERRRTERSEKPFLLTLINTNKIMSADFHSAILDEIASILLSSKRETDICGWYEHGSILGMIFTDIDTIDTQEAREAISSKIYRILAANIPPESMDALSLEFHYYPEKYDDISENLNLFERTLYPDIDQAKQRKRNGYFFKRMIDVIGSSLAILLFSPVICFISVLIKISSKGPVLFRQQRLGQFGVKFNFLKFRSMFLDCDDAIHRDYIKKLITENKASEEGGDDSQGPVYKIRNDPRITPLGAFLRKTSLDELPQLLNVLRGEMSLVGPRPAIPYEFENYDIWHRYRLLQVKPGITGLWQVSGRSSTTFDEMVRLDLKYIHEWSLWLDFKILLLTPWAVLKGKGAY